MLTLGFVKGTRGYVKREGLKRRQNCVLRLALKKQREYM